MMPDLSPLEEAAGLFDLRFDPGQEEWRVWYTKLAAITAPYRGFTVHLVDLDYGELSVEGHRLEFMVVPKREWLDCIQRAWPALQRLIIARIHNVNGMDACPARVETPPDPPF
jgi:hypothetical protein